MILIQLCFHCSLDFSLFSISISHKFLIRFYLNFINMSSHRLSGVCSCNTSPNNFCFICADFLPKPKLRKIHSSLYQHYELYFNQPLCDQETEKWWAPKVVCDLCRKTLAAFAKGDKTAMLKFSTPAQWCQPQNHFSDCYFCLFQNKSFLKCARSTIEYPTVTHMQRPIAPDERYPLPSVPVDANETDEHPSDANASFSLDVTMEESSDEDYNPNESDKFEPFTQEVLNDFIRASNYSKELSQLMSKFFKRKKMLAPGVTFSFYRKREEPFLKFFEMKEGMVFCNNVA